MAASSDDSDDDFVTLGTPLPEIIEGQPPKKPTTAQDLTARDKQGRRRFHGAFTGGFSAGYFNTVGTKEGFTPASFSSSRGQRNDRSEFRPEDFMDEEDLEEHGIAPRKFATVGSFTSEERKRRHQDEITQLAGSSSLSLTATLADLIVPGQLPIGIRLLRKMGWREGQGLGPRVHKKKKKRKKLSAAKPAASVKVYGCALPPSDDEPSDSDDFVPEDMSSITFAPKDVSPITVNAKNNVHGLGYHGLDPSLALPGSHINLFSAPPVRSRAGGKGIRGQAFGVGAFEEEDEDIYAVDSMSNYDITMQPEEDGDNKFGWTAPRQHGKQVVPASYVGTLLEGFTLASKQLKPKKKFPPPTLPRHFKPQHWFRKRREVSHLPEGLVGEDHGTKQAGKLNAVDRGLMLGEAPVMGSVFDLVPKEDKNRIEATKQAIAMTQSLASKVDAQLASKFQPAQDASKEKVTESNTSEPNSIRRTFLSKFKPADVTPVEPVQHDSAASGSASHTEKTAPLFQGSLSLQPFRKDPAKQARYDKYLQAVKHGEADPYTTVANSQMTEWERARERDEFAKAAKIFRPLSALMSTRFVQGAMIDDSKVEGPVDSESDKSDQAKAAEMKMFGKLTREEFEWHPDKLLCRRFNVPNPYPGSDLVGLPTVKRDKYSVFNFLTFGDYQPSETQEPSTAEEPKELEPPERTLKPKPNQAKKLTMASVFKVLDDPDFHQQAPQSGSAGKSEGSTTKTPVEKGETEQVEKEDNEEEEALPDQDLFRAIFKNSDSESSSDDNDDDKKKTSSEEEEDRKSDEDEREEEKNDDNHDDNVTVTSASKNSLDERAGHSIATSGDVSSTKNVGKGASSTSADKPASIVHETGPMSKRSRSRWGEKSVFSVIDDLEKAGGSTDMAGNAHNTEEPRLSPSLDTPQYHEDDIPDEFGPRLPPPSSTASGNVANSSLSELVSSSSRSSHSSHDRAHRTEKHRDRHDGRHKHRKEKKQKKSKHKKDKKHKKHKKSSKSRKSKRSKDDSSGSEADSESESDSTDVSDSELLARLKQASDSGKSLKDLKKL